MDDASSLPQMKKKKPEVACRKTWPELNGFLALFAAKATQDSSVLPRLCSTDLKKWSHGICAMAKRNDKRFFIDLGKCLSGDLKPFHIDKLDCDIFGLLYRNPSISNKEAVRELVNRSHPCLTNENFRMRKKRLLDALPEFQSLLGDKRKRTCGSPASTLTCIEITVPVKQEALVDAREA